MRHACLPSVHDLIPRCKRPNTTSSGAFHSPILRHRLQSWQAAGGALYSEQSKNRRALGGHQVHLQRVLGGRLPEAGIWLLLSQFLQAMSYPSACACILMNLMTVMLCTEAENGHAQVPWLSLNRQPLGYPSAPDLLSCLMQVDNLRTNHRGTFVLKDQSFRWLAKLSVDPVPPSSMPQNGNLQVHPAAG